MKDKKIYCDCEAFRASWRTDTLDAGLLHLPQTTTTDNNRRFSLRLGVQGSPLTSWSSASYTLQWASQHLLRCPRTKGQLSSRVDVVILFPPCRLLGETSL